MTSAAAPADRRQRPEMVPNPFRRRLPRRFANGVLATAISLPALALYAGVLVLPLGALFYYSTLRWDGFLSRSTFVGLDNFLTVASDPRFWIALKNTMVFELASTVLIIPLAFFLGFFLSGKPRGQRVLEVIFFSPAVLSMAARSMIFVGIYLPDGLINSVLRLVGLEQLTRLWLADPATAFASLIAVDVWGAVGFYAVLFRIAISLVPHELFDAARLDGCGSFTVMRRIALPLVIDFVGLMTMLHALWVLLGSAQIVLLLTQGGPGDTTLTVSYYIYSAAFQAQHIGYSQAMSVILFFLGLIIILVMRRLTRRSYL